MANASVSGSQRAYLSDPNTVAFETITVSTTAIGFTSATFGNADVAEVTLDGADIRFRLDGTAPTASVGHLLRDGDVLTIRNQTDIANFSAIRNAGANATISVSYS